MEDYKSIAEELFSSRLNQYRSLGTSGNPLYADLAFEADLDEIMRDFAATRTLSEAQLNEIKSINRQILNRLAGPPREEGAISDN